MTADPRAAPWRPHLVDYDAIAFVLHTDRDTAKRWFHSWAWAAGPAYLFRLLQGDV
jgi:hypothetical protein